MAMYYDHMYSLVVVRAIPRHECCARVADVTHPAQRLQGQVQDKYFLSNYHDARRKWALRISNKFSSLSLCTTWHVLSWVPSRNDDLEDTGVLCTGKGYLGVCRISTDSNTYDRLTIFTSVSVYIKKLVGQHFPKCCNSWRRPRRTQGVLSAERSGDTRAGSSCPHRLPSPTRSSQRCIMIHKDKNKKN